jgi:hypothetical protein
MLKSSLATTGLSGLHGASDFWHVDQQGAKLNRHNWLSLAQSLALLFALLFFSCSYG